MELTPRFWGESADVGALQRAFTRREGKKGSACARLGGSCLSLRLPLRGDKPPPSRFMDRWSRRLTQRFRSVLVFPTSTPDRSNRPLPCDALIAADAKDFLGPAPANPALLGGSTMLPAP